MPSQAPLFMHSDIERSIYASARAGLPYETCGLLGSDASAICAQWTVPSTIPSPFAFTMEPHAQVRAMLDLEAQGLTWSAIWHCHPTSSAYPSSIDIDQSQHWSDLAMVIVSYAQATPEMRAFRVINATVHELALVIIDEGD